MKGATVRNLLDMTVGMEFDEDYSLEDQRTVPTGRIGRLGGARAECAERSA